MLDRSSKPMPSGVSDALTEMLRGLRLDGVDYGRCQMTAPWGILFPAQEAARFHFIGRGGCWLLTPCKQWVELKEGDAVLLPRGAEHILASQPDVSALPIRTYEVKPICGNVFDVCGGGEGEVTLLFCGSMHFNVDSLHPLLSMMPDVMWVHELAAIEPNIAFLLEAMAREVTVERVGAGGMLARLADVLAASIIRVWVEKGCGDATGWIAAVRSPDVGRVLAAIHLQPDRDWTVAALARLMGASRSGFAERFASVVGETPARYVAQVRMHQARQWLVRDRMRISVVAKRLGYDSEASFSRAFKRVIGAPPSHFRAGETVAAAL
ncbi:AraC family transcriptional regulator [Mesorhizobium sp. LHD-90]|uniref:AraC family transcriptional regulator n=1 Tax=Mesorhizobium sp. LHD-90 TaxID=3071414 RepID=UPI0027E15F7F|nr:AraC family transcriptional regulator [Mesorhizobium sp. LHD-90]MDQ6433121.1 AraC family transcriptional regulator [Mesorhizobium sp. LHD-90]